MATLAEKLDAWEAGRLSEEGEKKLITRISTGSLDQMGTEEGIDMDSLRSYLQSKGVQVTIKGKEEFAALPEEAQADIKAGMEDRTITGLVKGTAETAVEGAKKAIGGVQRIAETSRQRGEIETGEKVTELVGGVSEVVGGGMEAVFAPVTETIERVPIANTLMEKFGESVGAASEFLADKIGTNENEKEVLAQSFNNLFNLAALRTAQSPRVQAAVESGVTKGLEVAKPAVEAIVEKSKTGADLIVSEGSKFTNWTKGALEGIKDTAKRTNVEKTIENNLEALGTIEGANAVVRRAVENASKKGTDVKQIVAETDLP